ncbi:YchJ family protein [Arthrobacter sp. 35W]|uniref:YchJ family protein n=1 Tax=Arthrobacter sp. 35W TaxID=1132441 RepID=UPI00047A0606|nr:YchJ family metal-binding protein [Arthrobacter sp. 35W]
MTTPPTKLPRTPDAQDRCPCLSGNTYGECCGRYLSGDSAAPTAEALMRSRFTAFATGDGDYLLRSWWPATRPVDLELDEDMRWYRLDILDTVRGKVGDDDGVVTFRAYYRHPDGAGQQQETSRFRHRDGHWYYVDALALD